MLTVSTVFFINNCSTIQDEKKQSETSEDEGMGKSDIKYGDTIVFIQHCDTGLWLSYQTTEVKKKGVGKVEEKKVDDPHFWSRGQCREYYQVGFLTEIVF